MNFHIEVKTSIGGIIDIIDRSKDFNNYVSENEDVYPLNNFKYTQCVTIDLLKKIEMPKSEDEDKPNVYVVGHYLNDHKNDCNVSEFEVNKDGHYVNRHLAIPTLEWFNNCPKEILETYERVYVVKDDKLLMLPKGSEEWVSSDVEGLIENLCGTNIQYADIDFFYLGNLEECYMNYCKDILYGMMQGCKINKCKPIDNSDKIYARDFLWMVINVIQYLIDMDQFREAQRILEQIDYCGGFCKNVNSDEKCSCGCCAPKKSADCGCGA